MAGGYQKTGMGTANGNRGNSANDFNVNMLNIHRFLRHMEQLYMTESGRMKAIRNAVAVIKNKAVELLQSDEAGRKVYQENPGAIRIRTNKAKSYMKVSGTGRDDWRMPWLANGTGYRDTKGNGPVIKKPAHRGAMKKPKGRYIERAVNATGTEVIDVLKKWFEDYIQQWKKDNPGKKI